ncbi:uncharacterized protein LOC144457793 [Phascolarctos cinereus]
MQPGLRFLLSSFPSPPFPSFSIPCTADVSAWHCSCSPSAPNPGPNLAARPRFLFSPPRRLAIAVPRARGLPPPPSPLQLQPQPRQHGCSAASALLSPRSPLLHWAAAGSSEPKRGPALRGAETLLGRGVQHVDVPR